jgi:hypothetical protein
MFPRSAIEPLFKQITETLDQNDETYRAEKGEPN